uniref:ImpL2 protein n=1 Tax=Drosophila melanogaster TaxID=7227 RepID=Q24365_DROME|nr:ORF2 [Drosophila melanogaster]
MCQSSQLDIRYAA